MKLVLLGYFLYVISTCAMGQTTDGTTEGTTEDDVMTTTPTTTTTAAATTTTVRASCSTNSPTSCSRHSNCCETEFCNWRRKCIAKKSAGSWCYRDIQCESGDCSWWSCRGSGGCSSHEQCQ